MKNKYSISVIAIIFSVFMISCRSKLQSAKEHSIGTIGFKVAGENNRMIKVAGTDSEVQYIILHGKDTLHLEYGEPGIIFKTREDLLTVLPRSEKENMEKLSGHDLNTDHIIWTDGKDQTYDSDFGLFLKSYYMYDTLHGIIAKIVQPKRTGNGITGVYIPELKDGHAFSLYGTNLDSVSNKEAMEIIRSIHYSKK